MRIPMLMLLAGAALVAHAQDAPRTKAISTLTRGVVVFGQRENALADAVRDQSREALERTLANDFEMRLGQRPTQPVPRAEWIASVLGHAHADAGAGAEIDQ